MTVIIEHRSPSPGFPASSSALPSMFPSQPLPPGFPLQAFPPVSNVTPEVPPPIGDGPHFKRVDKVLDPLTGQWVVSDTPATVYAKDDKDDTDAAQYSFIVERTLHYPQGPHNPIVTTQLLIHNEQLIAALKVVMKDVQSLSWNVKPFQIIPQTVLAFLPRLMTYLGDLYLKKTEDKWEQTAKQVEFLIEFLEREHEGTLTEISSLVSHGEITFELLWAILLPHTILFSSCSTTSEPRAYRLLSATIANDPQCRPFWNILCDYVDSNDQGSSAGQNFGRASTYLKVTHFTGANKISALDAYPLQWYPDLPSLREKLISRGKKWVDLHGVHHMSYNGLAYRTDGGKKQFRVSGRVMIDRSSFLAAEPNYGLQTAQWNMQGQAVRYMPQGQDWGSRGPPPPLSPYGSPRIYPVPTPAKIDVEEFNLSLTDDALLLATPILHGFSLTEKHWLEFNVERITPIEWNDETFKNLALDADRKLLIQSLVESHAQDQPLDDFVQGKGLGLVINLFGPPGVGKSLTVEATSEHLRKPLYVVSAGDLGTKPDQLDEKLTKIFSMTPVWNAVVMIDEADVFLEERGTHDIARNAMVAVFLRQIEYFRGILFLTTNRVKTFDQAFQSRIHLSLRYDDLSCALKGQIWSSFLQKARDNRPVDKFSAKELQLLSEEDLNGRQIKNVVKMAVALAGHGNEMLSFKHLVRTLDAMGRYGLSEKRKDIGQGTTELL